jgi:hypothetical protein
MTLPNFLIIGAAKSGTTAIYTYIKQHPQIFMSTPKELRFFSYSEPKSGDINKNYVHQGVTSLEEYEQYFADVTDEIIIGEASPMYLYTPGTAEKINKIIPNVKMLAILRNPVDRAYSAYMHGIREWKEPSRTFKEALEREPQRIEAGWGMLWHYTKAGFYYEQLKRFYDVFDNRQIKVVLYDDLLKDSAKLLKDIFFFLDVDSDFQPDISKRPNVSGIPKSSFLHKKMKQIFQTKNPIRWLSRIIFPKDFREQTMIKLRERNLEKKKIPKDIEFSLKELYKEDIKMLENLISRDLTSWI